MTDEAARPAGWYTDPDNPFQRKWWDGNAWTDKTQPIAGLAASDDRPRVSQTPAPAKPVRPFWYSWWFRIIIIVVVTGIIVLIKRGLL